MRKISAFKQIQPSFRVKNLGRGWWAQALVLLLLAAAVGGCSGTPQPGAGFAPVTATSAAVVLASVTPPEKAAVMVTVTTAPTADPNLPAESYPTNPTRTPLAVSDPLGGVQMGMITDDAARIQLTFPAGWSVTPVDEAVKQTAAVYTTRIESPAGDPLSPEPLRMELTVQKGPLTFEKALGAREAEFANLGWAVASVESWALPSGEPASLWNLESAEGPLAQMMTVIDGQVIILTGRGDLFLFKPIAFSLQRLTASK